MCIHLLIKKDLDILIGTVGTCGVIFGYYEDTMIYLMQIAKCFSKYQPH